MISPRWLVLALVAPLLLNACGDDPTAQLTIRADVKVCRTADECVSMPAAGARVQVVDSAGVSVLDKSLGKDGTVDVDVDAGDFKVEVTLLQLVTARTEVSAGEGEEVEVKLNLPRVTASK